MADKDKTVFISYRRNLSAFLARAVFADLKEHGFEVFMDVESIDSGTFDTIILNQIAARAHFIIILTPGTLERINEPGDWLRIEIERAMELERNIVPLLTSEFRFKDAKPYLAGKLAGLQRYNGITVHHEYFEAGMDKLRERFLKEPVSASITPTPADEGEAVRHMVREAADKPVPTQASCAEEYLTRGVNRYDSGDYRLAIEEYDLAIKISPRYSDAYNNRGNAYYELDDHRRAIADFNQAIQLNPQDAIAYYNRGNTYYDLGDHRQAIADYDQAIHLNPRYGDAYNNRGNAYYELDDHRRAIADYDQAIQIDPQIDNAYFCCGNSYLKLGDNRKAIANYDQAIHLNPLNASAYLFRGIAHFNLGDTHKSIKDYGQVIRLDPKNAHVYYLRGNAYGKVDKQKALDDYRKFLSLSSDENWREKAEENIRRLRK